MYRKLHNSMFAISTTGLMLVLGLMAASPSISTRQPELTQASTADAAEHRRIAVDAGFAEVSPAELSSAEGYLAEADSVEVRAQALEARITARAEQLQRDLDNSNSLADILANTAAFAAEVTTDAALNAAIDIPDEVESRHDDRNEQKSHAQRVRGVLAVPYFSFAQGLRRNSRS